jgi:hypothetical protein
MSGLSSKAPFAPCCISLDLEVDPRNGRFLKIGTLRPDIGEM